jgi:hypothetical protein
MTPMVLNASTIEQFARTALVAGRAIGYDWMWRWSLQE